MSRKYTFSTLAVTVGLVAGACGEQADPTSANDAGFTSVTTTASAVDELPFASLGGADICEALGMPTGCDANFSFVAMQDADGSVTGQYHDQFDGGVGVHATIDCLNIFGNQAWVSGTITTGPYAGQDIFTTVVDNGTSANDAPDQVYLSGFGAGIDCHAAPAFPLPLWNLIKGQVQVRGTTCSPDASEQGIPIITIPVDFFGSFCEGDMWDGFRLSLDLDATLDFTLDWDNWAQDIDILVWNPTFTHLECDFQGATGQKPETFFCDLSAGEHFLLVENYSALSGDPGPVAYHLTILEP